MDFKMNIDQRELRNTLGTFATGITVVTTTAKDGSMIGVTINSFASVSLDPPMVLFSLKTESPLNDIFLNADTFNINILSADQEKASNLFAGPTPDKFNHVEWFKGENGSPILKSCIGTLECKRSTSHNGGDHTIFIGEVTHYQYNPAGKPLLYFKGAYITL
jgi:flavin reductase (DIM6/NTAB) family NADH-FMN oxidoreductase RutF